ncbi:hypothetical protein [Rhodobacter sp. TJ_12]|uniref:hypothetical protein n=1 Tax=Rhodobacter sp. TJ_12 TaxID=2029399 RepID=UPI001CBE0E75|nr:hypothetical protein [Rhodobacter sp. TJ_12]
MAYEIHIERDNGRPISLNEWMSAVSSVDFVRLADTATTIVTNTVTGEKISNPATHGTAELFDPTSQTWIGMFRWFNGRISTRPSPDFQTFNSQQRSAMRALAALLGAQIVGDEGEIYE